MRRTRHPLGQVLVRGNGIDHPARLEHEGVGLAGEPAPRAQLADEPHRECAELDILSVKYSCEGTGSTIQLVSNMKVSGSLANLPQGLNWRMNLTANAPNSVLSPTGDYSFGLSDRGDQFYVRVSTDPTQPSQFSYGTAVRNSDGTITYTRRGAATGSFNGGSRTITVTVPLSALNAFVTKGPAIAPSSV